MRSRTAAARRLGHRYQAYNDYRRIAFVWGLGSLSLIIAARTYLQVGGLYAPGDHRRHRANAIFYVGVNLGAFQAPLICGTLGEEAAWHYGFAAAGVGMLPVRIVRPKRHLGQAHEMKSMLVSGMLTGIRDTRSASLHFAPRPASDAISLAWL